MYNKVFFKGLLAATLITVSTLSYAATQDSTQKTPVVKPSASKPKPAVAQSEVLKPASTPPVKTTMPKTATPVSTGTEQQPGTATTVAPTDRSINGQYQYLLSKTFGYQRPMLAAFYKSLSDSLNAERKKVKSLQASVATLTDSVKSLHKQFVAQQQTLAESSDRVDNISLLGINMTKSAYNLLMWGLVIAFGAAAAFVIVRSGSHSREAKYRIKLYEDLDEDYKGYKAKANDKEKKLARELQTARNRIEEITGNPY